MSIATGRLGKTQFEIFSADFIVDNGGGPTIKHLMMSPVIMKKHIKKDEETRYIECVFDTLIIHLSMV